VQGSILQKGKFVDKKGEKLQKSEATVPAESKGRETNQNLKRFQKKGINVNNTKN